MKKYIDGAPSEFRDLLGAWGKLATMFIIYTAFLVFWPVFKFFRK